MPSAGAIVLADGPEGTLRLRAVSTGRAQPRDRVAGLEPSSHPAYSQRLAQRAFSRGESILCHSVADDPELVLAQSINEGTMDSVLCVLLRTPRTRLGVLHLDRNPWQPRFTAADLQLADALAASVSAGIEMRSSCAGSATSSSIPSRFWPRRLNCATNTPAGTRPA